MAFGKGTLAGTVGLESPTSIDFGPDGRLYVGEQWGLVHIYTIQRNGPNSYAVTASETITSIKSVPNHDDNGQLDPSITTRLITGILVVGTASHPVIYVAHSDPRIGGGDAGDLNLDTNSSTISRLTWTGAEWEKLDLVRGLPRSEENHAANGMVLDPGTNSLYVAMGGNTNKGATSNNFALLPEFALSAAVLTVNLTAIGNTTYDLPTLDDETRAGNPDANDPFGGNNGLNQAKLVPGGPVQIYAPGFRNPYDIVLTQSGKLYTIDNGGNAGWGGVPVGEGPGGNCTNGISEPGTTSPDSLHLITGPGYYGGHPNPTRANMANTFNSSNPQSPVTVANAVECDYREAGPESGALVTFPDSTNGLAEYTASNFGAAMHGNLLAASWNGVIYRVQLDASGTSVTNSAPLFSNVGTLPLDVVALGPQSPFPGTIWVGIYGSNQIAVFEPNDFDSSGGGVCTGADNPSLDEDGDGFDNADEISSRTNPCSAADVPPDWDADHTSDLNDPDDDNDNVPDLTDAFALDPANGTTRTLPVEFLWENDGTQRGGILNLGFTGLMTNGVTTYGALYDPGKMTAGGAAGVVTVDDVSEGDAFGAFNAQEYGFQFGVSAHPETTNAFFVHTRILSPFSGLTPQAGQSMGLFVGTGDQDNYARIVVSGDGGGSIAFLSEIGGVAEAELAAAQAMPGPNHVDLYLRVDPDRSTVQPFYSVTTGGTTGPQIMLASPQTVPSTWFTNAASGLAVGIISSSRGPAPSFPATWDFIRAVPATAPPMLTATPASLAFGDVTVGGTKSLDVSLRSTGTAESANLVVGTPTVTGADAQHFGHQFPGVPAAGLNPGESAVVSSSFAPTSSGGKTATLDVPHSGSNTPLPVPLSGHGLAASSPTLGVSPTSLAFGDVTVGQTRQLTLQLTNLGSGNLVVDATSIVGTAAAQFSDDFDDAANATLAPGGTVSLAVTFAPASAGSQSAALEIAHSGSNSPLQVPLSGGGTSGTMLPRVNAGGAHVSGTPDWSADTSSSPSAFVNAAAADTRTYSVTSPVGMSHPSLPPGLPQTLLQTERYDLESGTAMQWSFPVTPGTYEVRLYFAELYFAGSGERTFDVSIEGTLVLNDYDIVADVGAFNGVMKSFVVTADSTLDVLFGRVVENPKINAIEVRAASSGMPGQLGVSPSSLDFGSVPVGQSAARTLQLTNLGGPGDPEIGVHATTISGAHALEFSDNFTDTQTVTLAPGESTTITLTLQPTTEGSKTASVQIDHFGTNSPIDVPLTGSGAGTQPPPPSAVYRVNAGGSTVGTTWSADTSDAPSPYVNAQTAGNTTYSASTAVDMTHPSMPSGTPGAVLQSERYDPGAGGLMQWSFPVTPGSYQVRLYFAELWFTSPGERTFDVSIEGTLVLDDYDIVADVGTFRGVVKTFTVTADNSLDIVFGRVVENPKINAIEIVK